MGTNSDNQSNGTATAELYRNNLFRLELAELLKESILHVSPHSGELQREVKWADQLRDYVNSVKDVLLKIKPTSLNPEMTMMVNDGKNKGDLSSWVPLHSDKATLKKNQTAPTWDFHFPGGQSLQIESVGCYGAGGVGLTTFSANARVLPTIDVAVLIPSFLLAGENTQDEIGMIGGKDYLNHRYFDVSFFSSLSHLNLNIDSS